MNLNGAGPIGAAERRVSGVITSGYNRRVAGRDVVGQSLAS